jgi:hypothetical protein
MAKTAKAETPEMMIADDCASFFNDPYGFVMWCFDWGYGELEGQTGPDFWQEEQLRRIGQKLEAGADKSVVIREAIASGHGIGKSAEVGWIALWAMSTDVDCMGVITANTETQLKTKTWANLAKWYRLSLVKCLFTLTATALFSNIKEHEKTWRIDAVPWSEKNTEAFAGLHNAKKRVLLIFDEASAIPPLIWEVSKGALTDLETQIIWLVYGNPTRNTGDFHACFHGERHRWEHIQIDSRKSKLTNKDQIQEWIDDYGEDSDFVRVRVRGVFPRASAKQLIPTDLVEAAAGRVRHPSEYNFAPRIIGVDVAREGDDQSVIIRRQGLMASGLKKFRGLRTTQLAKIIQQEIIEYKPDAVFIDRGDAGAGVIDRLVQLGYGDIVVEVKFGADAKDRDRFKPLRSEMWWDVREWLKAGGCIPDDQELRDDLTGPEYDWDDRDRVKLERKKDMKSRGLASPDNGDALAVTFAYPVHINRFEEKVRELGLTTGEKAFDPLEYRPGGM